jgi:PadR family transcriptional regulator PadR
LQDLEAKHVSIEANTLYPMLRRLEQQGLLKSDWDTTESRPRKYYQLNATGQQVYDELKKAWMKLNNEMIALFDKEETL